MKVAFDHVASERRCSISFYVRVEVVFHGVFLVPLLTVYSVLLSLLEDSKRLLWTLQTEVETAFSSHPAVAGGVKILFESHLGGADLHLPNNSCVFYLSECDIIAGNGYKRKLVRYRNVSFGHKLVFFLIVPWPQTDGVRPLLKGRGSFQALVLVENSRLCQQYFPSVQKFVTFDLGLTLMPVGGQTEASQLISHMVNHQHTKRRGTRVPPLRAHLTLVACCCT